MHIHHLIHVRLLPFIAVSIPVEIAWYLLVQGRAYPWREMAASLGVVVLRYPGKLVRPLVIGPIIAFIWSHRVMTIPLNTAWGLGILFLGEELAYYWMHRSSHEIRWLWASHVVHHTPEHLHLASAFRIGGTELLSGGWLFYTPLYVLGLNPLAVAGMLAANLAYQFWLHTDLIGRLGPIEWIFNTPSHHRVHHASNREYLDRNYGGIVIIWDRLFGTFVRERADTRIVYGLVHPIGSLNPLRITLNEWGTMFREFHLAGSWRERLRTLFGRPGSVSEQPQTHPAVRAVVGEAN